MKFVSYGADSEARVGVVHDSMVFGLRPGVSLLDLLGDDGETLHNAGARALADPHEVIAVDRARLRAPIPRPPTFRHFVCFEEHLEGVQRIGNPRATVQPEFYRFPAFHFSNPYGILGPYDDVPVSPGSVLFDFALEVAAVIGRGGRDIDPGRGDDHIVGYLILNDWSARDVQHEEMRMLLGPAKSKDTTTTIGPWLVTADELEPHRRGNAFDREMRAEVNGQVIGADRWHNMYWSYGELVAYGSRGTWVRPGDLIGSGTCAMGCLAELWGRYGFDAHAPLGPGDVVTLSVDGLGTMRNRVVEGTPVIPLRKGLETVA